MTNTITLSPEALQQMIATALQTALAASQPLKAARDRLVDGKTERSIQNEIATMKAFKKRGFKEADIRPRETVMTYNLWIMAGRKVKAGEECVKVKNLRLFHITQTEPISQEMKEVEAAKIADAIAKHAAKKGGEQRASA